MDSIFGLKFFFLLRQSRDIIIHDATSWPKSLSGDFLNFCAVSVGLREYLYMKKGRPQQAPKNDVMSKISESSSSTGAMCSPSSDVLYMITI